MDKADFLHFWCWAKGDGFGGSRSVMEPGVGYDVKELDCVQPLQRVLSDLVFVHEPPYWSRVGAHDDSANGLFCWGY